MKKITLLLLLLLTVSFGYSQTELLNLSFDAAGSESVWTPIADAAAQPAEVTIAFNVSGNGTGATELSGVNTADAAGRAYIFRYDDATFDFGTSDQVSISMDLKIDNALLGTNLVLETQVSKVGGGVVVVTHNNLENTVGVGVGWVTLTFDMTPNPAEFNNAGTELYFYFNMAAGAFVGAGGTIFVDNVVVTGSELAAPTCTDEIQNGDETGVDCGGPDCQPCATIPPLNLDFETTPVTADFTNFEGGTATVIPNPQGAGNVGQMVRDGGQVYAGAFLTLDNNPDFSTLTGIRMKVWTEAPIGTKISIKTEGGTGSGDKNAYTTVTGAWETLAYDFTGAPGNDPNLTFLFDFGNVGDGTATSTFLFDDVEQFIFPVVPPAGPPTTAAPAPPARAAADVISIFSEPYTDVTTSSVLTLNGATLENYTIESPDDTKLFTAPSPGSLIEYQFFDASPALDLTDFTHMHIDFYVEGAATAGSVLQILLINFPDYPSGAGSYNLNTQFEITVVGAGAWVSGDVELSNFNNGAAAKDKIALVQVVAAGPAYGPLYIDNIYLHKNTTLGTKDFEIAGLNVYPNPAQDSWTVKTQNIKMSSIQVFDILGKQVLSLKPEATEAKIDASVLKSGLYFAKINTANGSSSVKLVRQ